MGWLRVPLRAGGPAGAPVVTWAASSAGVMQAFSLVQTRGLRAPALSALAVSIALATPHALRARRGQASVTALANYTITARTWFPTKPVQNRTYRRYSRDDYHQMLMDLLPRGLAWPRDGEDEQLMYAWSAELERVEKRGQQLLNEWDPRTTQEMFTDWEQFFELAGTGGDGERRQKLIAEWLEGGTLSQEDLDALLKTIGVNATVYYWREFRCGMSTCGDALATGWFSTITVYVHNPADVDLVWLKQYLEHIASGGDNIIIVEDPR